MLFAPRLSPESSKFSPKVFGRFRTSLRVFAHFRTFLISSEMILFIRSDCNTFFEIHRKFTYNKSRKTVLSGCRNPAAFPGDESNRFPRFYRKFTGLYLRVSSLLQKNTEKPQKRVQVNLLLFLRLFPIKIHSTIEIHAICLHPAFFPIGLCRGQPGRTAAE